MAQDPKIGRLLLTAINAMMWGLFFSGLALGALEFRPLWVFGASFSGGVIAVTLLLILFDRLESWWKARRDSKADSQ